MYRIIVLLIDFCVLGLFIFLAITEAIANDYKIYLSSISFVILNLIYVLFSKTEFSNTEKESWIKLYFQRKREDEKRKIKTIRNE